MPPCLSISQLFPRDFSSNCRLLRKLAASIAVELIWLPASWCFFIVDNGKHQQPMSGVTPHLFISKDPDCQPAKQKGRFHRGVKDFTWANVSWQPWIQPSSYMDLISTQEAKPLDERHTHEERRALPRCVCACRCIPAVNIKHERCRNDPSGVISVVPHWWCVPLMSSWIEASCL